MGAQPSNREHSMRSPSFIEATHSARKRTLMLNTCLSSARRRTSLNKRTLCLSLKPEPWMFDADMPLQGNPATTKSSKIRGNPSRNSATFAPVKFVIDPTSVRVGHEYTQPHVEETRIQEL